MTIFDCGIDRAAHQARALAVRAPRMLPASVALLTLCTTALGAQQQSKAVQYGVEAGAAIATLVGGDANSPDSRTSPFIGLTLVTQRPRSSIGFQTGVQLVNKGASINEEGFTGELRLRYVEVPLMLRFAPALAGSRLVPALTIGGTAGIRVGCSVKASGGGFSTTVDCDEDLLGEQAQIKRFEAGLAIGAELGIPYRERLLIVPMVRYTRGLTKIGESDTGEDDVRNSVIQLGVGLRFRR